MSGGADYKPLPPERLYLKPSQWDRLLEGHSVGAVHQLRRAARGAERRRSRRPPPRRLRPGAHGAGRQPVRQGGRSREGRQRGRPPGRGRGLHRRLGDAPARICCRSMAPRRRCRCADYATVQGLPPGVVGVAVWPLEHGFVLDGLEVIGEEDILGDRLSRPQRKRRPSERFIAEAAALSEGDLVVHREHGVGRYEGLVTLEIQFARHDCLQAHLRGRRQALRAGREHRRAEPLRRGARRAPCSTGWAASPGSRARRG